MCLACEQGEQERLWELVEIISTGKMPDGHTVEDLLAMGLPLPGELYREEQPDGTVLIRQHSPATIEAMKSQATPKNTTPKNTFVCDTPDND
ncbi:MAG: hypothetical protein GC182_02720 [Rhodopseudomonas sp.]|nr:hypothetical protein [Rhodopseudomonas sp.]